MANIKIEGSHDALCCPGCGEPEIHQESVEVVIRDGGEDGPGTKVTVNGGEGKNPLHAETSRVMEKEIPGRRQHVAITFSCEHCWCVANTLLLMQHKGATLMEWLPPVDKTGDPIFDPNVGMASRNPLLE